MFNREEKMSRRIEITNIKLTWQKQKKVMGYCS